ncbi:MAG: PAS domain-containing protein [Geminicoccaceae bacterium]
MHSEIWPAFLERGGEMGERIRAFDWSNHPLGPPETWPQPLRMAIRLILNTGHPMYIWWGPELYCFYNDAYRQSIGPERHPGSLGRPGREVWDEIWHIIGPQIRQVMAGGSATWNVNALVPITRNGRREDVYWTYSYGPIDDERAPTGVGGILVVCTETTATVMAEKRLAAKSERERRPFEQAPGFIIVMGGPDHVVEFVNDAHRALFNSADWVGKPVREAVPSIDGQGLFEHLDTVYATGESYEAAGAEIRFRRSAEAAEETRFLTFIFTPWFGGDGEIAGIFCEGFDVTEARHGEAALRESEALLRLATEAAAIGIWDYHPVSDELRWDRRCRELFGVSEDAAISYESTFLAGLHPEDRARIDAAVQSALAPAGSGIYNVEFRTIGIEDGVERWLAASGNAMFEAGRAVRFVGTLRDITPRVRADRRLEIVNRTGAAIAADFDLANIVQTVTDAGVELTGAQFGAFFYNVVDEAGERYTLYALSGVPRSAFEKFPLPRNTPVFAPTFKGEGPVRSDDILADPRYGTMDGYRGMPPGHLPVRSYLAVPVVARTGEVHGGLFFGHGEVGVFGPEHEPLLLGIAGHAATAIDNARLVHDLQSLNANLEQRVTAEVADRLRAEEMLVQSQKLEALGQLTGGVAHDFNNLLMVISSGINIIERADNPERRAMILGRMRDSIERGARLTQQLLAFSRKQELKPERIALAELLTGMSELLDRSLGPDIHVELDVPADLAPVHVDRTGLHLAVLNLLVNARDAMEARGTIVIRARNGAADDPTAASVSLAVLDTGAGMSRETQSRVFEPFFTTKPAGKGSGLGLAQVHGFTQQSGGRVEVEIGARVRHDHDPGPADDADRPRRRAGESDGRRRSLRHGTGPHAAGRGQ